MNISEPFIKRPVMTTLVMISILFLGVFSYRALPVNNLPNVDLPIIIVEVSYPGANPTTMANTVATPLEKEFASIDGLDTMLSNNISGKTLVILRFTLDKDLDAAALDVESAITRAQPNLPDDLPFNPTYKKLNPAQSPILYIALTNPGMTTYELYDYANSFIGQRLGMIDGISQVTTYGSPYAVRVQVDPEELAAKEIGIDEVVQAIKDGNVDLPTGALYGSDREFTITAEAQLKDANSYNQLVLKAEDGSLVKIKDIGNAIDSQKQDKYKIRYVDREIDEPAVLLAVQTLPGANAVKVTEKIDDLLPKIKEELPASISYHTLYRKATLIYESVNEVKFTLIAATILVILIIYLTLGKAKNTIIPSLAIPLSIFGTFIAMFFFSYSIDILSLLALTLSIGFLVDDAIVVLENSVRHVQMGKSPYEASLAGAKEISITIFSMTLCLAIVFIPMVFLGGVVGKLFREFAVVIVIAVVMSGIVSITLTPLLCSRYIPAYTSEKKGRMERFAEKWIHKLLGWYKTTLEHEMGHRWITLIIGASSVFVSAYLFVATPKDFLPIEDQGFIRGFSKAQEGTSPFLMEKYHKEIIQQLKKNPNLESIVSIVPIPNLPLDNQGAFFTKLKPFDERPFITEVIEELQNNMKELTGVKTFMSPLPVIDLQLGTTEKAMYQYTLTSISSEELNKTTNALQKKFTKLPSLTQVSSNLQINQPQLNIDIDRDRASDLKITAKQMQNMLGAAYADTRISTIKTSIDQYEVQVETLPTFYKNPTVLSSLYVRNMDKKMIPLNEFVTATETVGPSMVSHLDGLPSATISFNIAKGYSLSNAINNIEQIAKDTLPSKVTGSFQGTSDVFRQSLANIAFLFVITIFLIYLVLGILYESFIHPLTVMSALPPATMGGLLALYLTGNSLSLYSFIGIIMLVGIVMKNGIMMVDFANEAILKEKKNAYDAIIEACLIRFRPILMTTFSAFMGALPIALGVGGAAASRRPLGIAIVGGLFISQLITLFLTPVIYYYLEIIQEKVFSLMGKTTSADEKS